MKEKINKVRVHTNTTTKDSDDSFVELSVCDRIKVSRLKCRFFCEDSLGLNKISSSPRYIPLFTSHEHHEKPEADDSDSTGVGRKKTCSSCGTFESTKSSFSWDGKNSDDKNEWSYLNDFDETRDDDFIINQTHHDSVGIIVDDRDIESMKENKSVEYNCKVSSVISYPRPLINEEHRISQLKNTNEQAQVDPSKVNCIFTGKSTENTRITEKQMTKKSMKVNKRLDEVVERLSRPKSVTVKKTVNMKEETLTRKTHKRIEECGRILSKDFILFLLQQKQHIDEMESDEITESYKPSDAPVSAYLRLYGRSEPYQVEGKQRRKQVEERLRSKSVKGHIKTKISLDRGCRLYYVPTESMKLRYLAHHTKKEPILSVTEQ